MTIELNSKGEIITKPHMYYMKRMLKIDEGTVRVLDMKKIKDYMLIPEYVEFDKLRKELCAEGCYYPAIEDTVNKLEQSIKDHSNLEFVELTIGVGRNILSGVPLSDDVINLMLEEDIDIAGVSLGNILGSDVYHELAISHEYRWYAFINMSFNLGQDRLSGFIKMIPAIKEAVSLGNKGNWQLVAEEAVDSKWYREDIGTQRAMRIVNMIKHNTDHYWII